MSSHCAVFTLANNRTNQILKCNAMVNSLSMPTVANARSACAGKSPGIALAVRRALACTACLFVIACGPRQLVSLLQEDAPAPVSDASKGDQIDLSRDFLRAILLDSPGASSLPLNAPEDASPHANVSFFNQIVTLEAVFPNPRLRALHRMIPPETVNGRYGYAFYLTPQPGMNETHDYYNELLIIWEPAGSGKPLGDLWAIGPGAGGFVKSMARTHDGLYDLRILWFMRLPVTLDMEIDADKLAEKMLQRYKHYVQESNQSLKGK
jgi:hypothetical protein